MSEMKHGSHIDPGSPYDDPAPTLNKADLENIANLLIEKMEKAGFLRAYQQGADQSPQPYFGDITTALRHLPPQPYGVCASGMAGKIGYYNVTYGVI